MRDDELMDQLLRDAMASDAPQLSPGFDARVMRHLRPRRLSPICCAGDRYFMSIVAMTAAAWLMRDLRIEWIAAAVAIGVPVAAGASAYGRRLAVGH